MEKEIQQLTNDYLEGLYSTGEYVALWHKVHDDENERIQVLLEADPNVIMVGVTA